MTTKTNEHKLIRFRSGAGDAYARGMCSCGHWDFRGWTERARDVVNGHRSHVERAHARTAEYHPNSKTPFVCAHCGAAMTRDAVACGVCRPAPTNGN